MGGFAAFRQSILAIPISFYGFAFHKACLSIGSAARSQTHFDFSFIPTGPLSVVLAFVLAAVAFFVGSQRVRSIALPCGIAAQLVSGALVVLLYYAPIEPMPVLYLVLITEGLGVVLLSTLWVDLYARLNPIRAIFCNAVSVVVAQIIIFFIEQDPADRLFAALLLAPLLTAACYSLALRSFDNPQDGPLAAAETKESFAFPYKATLFIAAYSFAYGVAAMTINMVSSRYASIIPNLAIIALMAINIKRFNASTLFRFTLPLMIVGFMLVALLPGSANPFARVILDAGFASMEILLLMMVCTISYSTGSSAIWLFGILSGTQFLMRQVGSWLGSMALASADSTFYIAASIVSAAAVLVTSLLIMSEKNLFAFWRIHGSETPEDNEASDFIKIRINSLSLAHGLTDREIEVFYLMAQGKTNLEIAHDTFISEGTVKAHLHHIYQKFGVHTRKELMQIVESR